MYTVISWDRERNQWYSMRGFTDQETAFDRLEQWIPETLPTTVISVSDPAGNIVWAEIGKHPVIGRCKTPECWCLSFDSEFDHTMQLGSSNT